MPPNEDIPVLLPMNGGYVTIDGFVQGIELAVSAMLVSTNRSTMIQAGRRARQQVMVRIIQRLTERHS
jgi:hypothetical protein